MLRTGCLVAVAGCAQLAGIDETSKPGDGGDTSARLVVERVQIGKTVVRGPADLSGLTASFLVADDTAAGGFRKIAATASGDTWRADVGGAPVPVMFESPDFNTKVLRILDVPALALKVASLTFEHPMPEPAPMMAAINVNVALDSAHGAESYQLFTVGAWSQVGLGPPAAGGTQLVAGPFTIQPANTPLGRVDRLTMNDGVYILRYAGNKLVSVLDVPPFEQTDTTSITGTLVANPQSQTLDMRVNQLQIAQRISTVRPAVGAPSYIWRLHAAPGIDYAIATGPQLEAASIGAPAMADPQRIMATYGNPFTGMRTLLQWESNAGRTYTNNGVSTGLAAGFFHRAEPAAGITLAHPAGLPDRITANGSVLNVDNVSVTAGPNTPIDVSFVTDAAANTLYHVQVLELVPNMTAFALSTVVVATSPMPRARIPRDLFKDGSRYVIRAHSMQGCYTAVASGDLAQVGLPCSLAYADSGVFQVVSP